MPIYEYRVSFGVRLSEHHEDWDLSRYSDVPIGTQRNTEQARGDHALVIAEDLPNSFLEGILDKNPIASSILELRSLSSSRTSRVYREHQVELVWNRNTKSFNYIRWDGYETVSRRQITEEDILSDLETLELD